MLYRKFIKTKDPAKREFHLQKFKLYKRAINKLTSLLVIDKIKINKSTGLNSIPTKVLKITHQIICYPLAYLINFSFTNDVFLDLLKNSNVTPVFKNGENQDYNNYRPISLI